MTKIEFLHTLRKKLSGLPENEIEERLTFYSEMIDDGMEEGLSEEEAIARIGAIEDPTVKVPESKQQQRKQTLSPWVIVLLIIGAPLWISLLVAAFSVVISLYVALWSVIVSLWATEVALWGCVLGGLLSGIVSICTGSASAGVAHIGMALVCAGLSLFLFYGCKAVTKGTGWLTKKIFVKIRYYFFNRGYVV